MVQHLVILLLCLCFLAILPPSGLLRAGEKPQPDRGKKVFPSPLAGTWYENDPAQLGKKIDGYMNNVPDTPLSPASALILPHAGLQWSGQTAAYGIKQLAGKTIRRIIMLGPSHHAYMKNSASLPDASHYATPFGEVPLDLECINKLLQSPYFQVNPAANQPEHSVQVVLPMLQRTVENFSYVPIVLGRLDLASTKAIAALLRQQLDDETLLIVSSDFTHYGRNFDYLPFTTNIAENLEKLDMGAFELIKNKDLQGFSAYLEETGATICGRAAIEVLLAMLSAEQKVHLLHSTSSGAKTGDYSSSVSYLSAAVTGSWGKILEEDKASDSPGLREDDKHRLLALAKATLHFYLQKGKTPTPQQLAIEITPGMQQIMGAFVTLRKHGDLRGCIGEITPVRPLYAAVMQRAIDAAVHDYRFAAVKEQEFRELTVEISALTPPTPVSTYHDIVIGRDGVVLQKQGKSAVFLPQVAAEQGWGRDEMLSHLAVKAGLPADSWQEGASFTVFQALVFGDNEQ